MRGETYLEKEKLFGVFKTSFQPENLFEREKY